MKQAALHNLGCKVNAYETEAMQQRLEEAGYQIVPFAEKADVYIINTCTVTNIADRKSRQMLHRAKKQNPQAIVVAVGCYAQASIEACEADKAIDIIIGNNKKHEIVSIIEAFQQQQAQQLSQERQFSKNMIEINHTKEYEDISLTRLENHTRAIIKVQDGCNQFCTYCIIPYVRGRVRSRRLESVLEEAEVLAKQGYKEIVLTGIHLSSYGIACKTDVVQEEQKETLLFLIQQLHKIQGIERIRLGSLEPRIITEEFVSTICQLPKVCPHFHLSLQSGCDSVLKRMNRRYRTQEYFEKCKLLRKFYDNPAITTDIIVGFPGETEEEFLTTKKYLEQIHFFEMHIFKYSRRSGTKAAVMPDQIAEIIKTERSNQLLQLEKVMSAKYRKQWIGRLVEVLLEERITISGIDGWIGHTKEYIKVIVTLTDSFSIVDKSQREHWQKPREEEIGQVIFMENQTNPIRKTECKTGQIVLVKLVASVLEDTLLGVVATEY